MSYIKIRMAIKKYNGFKGDRTLTAILNQIPDVLINKLTSTEIALVMEIVNTAHHTAKKDISLEDDCIWVGLDVQKLIPLNFLKTLDKAQLDKF